MLTLGPDRNDFIMLLYNNVIAALHDGNFSNNLKHV